METQGGARRLVALDGAAREAGLRPGQKAADARALLPEVVLEEAEPHEDARALEALADWCVRYSPAVAPDPPDGLFLDVTGVSHLWGGEDALMADLSMRLERNGLSVRLALADTPGAAWALARHGRARRVSVAPGGQLQALASLPPAALRIPAPTAAQLERLGLRQIGQLVGLPRAGLRRRYGAELVLRLDQALGQAAEALRYRRPSTPWFAARTLAEPVSQTADLERMTLDLAADLCGRLETAGRGARRFRLVFYRLDGVARALVLGLARPGREAARIAELLRPRLEEVDPGFGIEAGSIEAEEVVRLDLRASALLEVGESAEERLAPMVDRLANRLGEGRLWRCAPANSHVPERAVRRTPPLGEPATEGWDPRIPRPLRLLRRPEVLDLVFALTPDDPPRQFRWRGRLHRVRAAEGPERIAQEWWRQPVEAVRTDQVRDYYRVEDEQGVRYWIFRAGLYGEPRREPGWWLHGLFG